MEAPRLRRSGKVPVKMLWPIATIVILALLWFMFAGPPPHGDGIGPIPGCLNEADLEQLLTYYSSDPEGTSQEFLGHEYCLDVAASFVDKRPHAVGVALDLGYMGSTFLYTPDDQEDYQKLLAWSDDPSGGDRIKMVCTLTEFKFVEGGPEPVVLPDFNDCWIFR